MCNAQGWPRHLFRLISLTLLLLSHSAVADVQYVYDNANRLVQVIAQDGSSAGYRYDPAGNILGIDRYASGQLALSAFTPASGAAGSVVTIWGSGFSNTPSQNTVQFNGVAAVVTSASENKLTVTVPASATTGLISVATNAGSISSADQFLIAPVPTISGFSPGVANVGGSVTVTGTNFDASPHPTQVSIGAISQITALTSTSLSTTVPAKATSGPIVVRTPFGEAASSAYIIVPPATIAAANVVASAQVTAGGASGNLTVSAGKFGVLAFHADQGQYLSVQINSLTVTPSASVNYTVYAPGNSGFATGSISATSRSIHLPPIQASGIHIVVFAAGGSSVQIGASAEVNPFLDGTGAAVSTSTGAVYQSKRFIIPAVLNQDMGVGLTGLALTPNSGSATIAVKKPDGNSLDSVSCSPGSYGGTCAMAMNKMPQAGNYIATVTPTASAAMSFTFSVTRAVTGTLTAGTPFSISLASIGQHAMLSFTATAGQTVALNVSSVSTTPANQNLWIGVLNASGTQIAGSGTSTGLTYNLTNLAAGTYRVQISPYNGILGSAQVKLVDGLKAVLPVDGSSSSFSTSVPWQAAYFTFAATADQDIGVGITGLALTPNSGTATMAVYRPDGGWLNGVSCSPATFSGTCAMSLLKLPQTGTYKIIVTPSAAATMNFTMSISQAVASTLTVGTPVNVSMPVIGQFAVLTFTATAGQTFALNVSSVATTPANQNLWIGVLNASGTQIAGSGTSTGLTYNLTNLAAGTYRVQISPYNGILGSAQVKLVDGLKAVLPVDGSSSSFSTSVPWQAAYFTFAATADQDIGVGITGLALTPNSGTATMAVYRPDGGWLNGVSCSPATFSGTCAMSLLKLPQTGTYKIIVTPSAAATMNFTMSISQAVASTLTVGTPVNVSMPVIGQFAVLTFTATAGQTFALNVSSVATTPASQNLWIGVLNASGTQIVGSGTSTGLTYNLTNLAAGTYRVQISPYNGILGSAQVRLANGITATLPVDGSSNSFSTSLPSQATYFTFAGTANQDVAVGLTGLTLAPNSGSAGMNIYRPDGSFLSSVVCNPGVAGGTCQLPLQKLPQTGNYKVVVTPSNATTMSFTLSVSEAITGALALNTPLNLTFPIYGQFAVLSFTATAGQSFTLNVGSISTTPSGQNVWVGVHNPAGTQIAGNGSGSSVTLNLNSLAAGTYRVFISPYYGVLGSVQVTLQ